MLFELPKVKIKGKLYYQDNRLEEFRAVDNPHDRIQFKDYFREPRPFPRDNPNGQPRRLLDHRFGDLVREIVVVAFPYNQLGVPSSMQDIIIEKNQEALIKEGFDGCEIKRNDELKTRFLICSK